MGIQVVNDWCDFRSVSSVSGPKKVSTPKIRDEDWDRLPPRALASRSENLSLEKTRRNLLNLCQFTRVVYKLRNLLKRKIYLIMFSECQRMLTSSLHATHGLTHMHRDSIEPKHEIE